jgi:GH15 family glucan-1,4-alpha-glucosidase
VADDLPQLELVRPDLARRSVAVILDGQHASGAYVACPTFPPYAFCWFRDGSFVADAMSRVGEVESAERFFDWCTRVILARRAEIEAGADPHTRYTLDGRDSPVEWPTFQLDGYGLWLWALRAHGERHGRRLERWQEAAAVTVGYLSGNWQRACTDWWEEQEGMHAATLACVAAGLRAFDAPAAELVEEALELEADWRLDGSLLAIATPLGVLPPDRIPLAEIERALVSAGGGVRRHEADTYYGGGEWLLLTALLGWHYAELGRTADARAKLDWVRAHATPEGFLPEQAADHLLAPERRAYWLGHWGEPPCPLLWSHAMFLDLAHALGDV